MCVLNEDTESAEASNEDPTVMLLQQLVAKDLCITFLLHDFFVQSRGSTVT